MTGMMLRYLAYHTLLKFLARDYRFFESDMIHPNSVAVDYIWDKLTGSMFTDEAIRTMCEVSSMTLNFLLRR